ncbi:MAG TPA: diguanylate cyclase [Thiobacillus sp.]|nr:diguanylate cyclase [Thiobacillus sp.]
MPVLPSETDIFIAELDTAVEAHMNWTRRILRCAVLRTTPGEDVLDPMAHTLCHFGSWFMSSRAEFEALDAQAAQRVEAVHQAMHDAIRSICTRMLAGQPGNHADLESFEQSQSELLVLLARFKTLILTQAVRYDPLTGLPLRYGIENDFSLYRKEARRNRNLLYVAMIDMDHFKPVNDTHGHLVGDQVLRQLAGVLKQTLRSNEPLYRFGGEEFLWLLQCKSVAEAEQSAQRLLSAIRTTSVPIPGGVPLVLTVTLGLTRVCEQDDLSSAIMRADRALYDGKKGGRDRYVIADP